MHIFHFYGEQPNNRVYVLFYLQSEKFELEESYYQFKFFFYSNQQIISHNHAVYMTLCLWISPFDIMEVRL